MCVRGGTRGTPAGGVGWTGMLPWSSGQELEGCEGRRMTSAGMATNLETKISNFCVTLLMTPIIFMFNREKERKDARQEGVVWKWDCFCG